MVIAAINLEILHPEPLSVCSRFVEGRRRMVGRSRPLVLGRMWSPRRVSLHEPASTLTYAAFVSELDVPQRMPSSLHMKIVLASITSPHSTSIL
jgi:hypothetical protein